MQQGSARVWPETLEGRAAVSALLHLLVLFLLTNAWWFGARKMHPAGTMEGTRTVMMYKPGKLSAAVQDDRRVVRQVKGTHRPTPPKAMPTPALVVPTTTSTDAAKADGEAGDSARGDGSASLSYVQAFPVQRPDFSSQGAAGDIVVDVQIDETGKVQQAFARRGMSSSIDEMVLATVRQWVFNPARKGGHPVTSVQELHFHYDRSWSKTVCGWECVGLMSQ